jgi:capsular polysaccharide biosynthesis protein
VKQSEPSVDNDGVRTLFPRSAVPWLLIVTLAAAGAAAAAGYGLTAPKRYRATALLLVSPVPASDTTFVGLDLLRDVGGKRTAAASAAVMLSSPEVVAAVKAQLGLPRSPEAVLAALHATVIGGSDVVAVTAEDTSANGAAQLANAFAGTLVSQRTASLQSQLATAIKRDTQLLQAMSPSSRASGAGVGLQERLTALRGFLGQPDPTLRVTAQASAPSSVFSPKVPRLIEIGAGAGLAAGLVAAILILLGRGRGAAGRESDRPMSERLVKRLEQRATERIDTLLAEQKQLLTREAELVARERDVAAQLEQANVAAYAHPAAVDDVRERSLVDRHAELSAQERELAAREARLVEREQHLAETAAPAAAQPGPEVEQRERELETRVAALGHREAELARRAAAVAAREREGAEQAEALERHTQELEGWAAELAARKEEPVPVPVPVPEPEPEPAPLAAAPEPVPVTAAVDEQPVPAGDGRWNLFALQRLVEEHGVEHPERVEEWASYLYFLREYAEPDGTVPASFDWLIEETFTELVG